jgi:dihydroflavonol-4-reductase
MRALVTGGGGFLGARLVEALELEGLEVRVLGRSLREGKEGKREFIVGDILDPQSLRRAMRDCELVFHTAGLVSYDPGKAEQMQQTNVVGTKNVAEAALALGIRRLIYTSSTAAIGVNYDPRALLSESSEFNARPLGMAYFTTKFDAELELHALRDQGLDFVIVNPGSILGPKDTRKKRQVYAGLIERINPPVAPPGGNCFVDIEDVVAGHLLAWKKGRLGERYILGGENLSFFDLISRVNAILGRRPPRFRLPAASMSLAAFGLGVAKKFGLKTNFTPELVRQMGSWYLYMDFSKAKRDLGYRPSSVDGALRATLDWLSKENG